MKTSLTPSVKGMEVRVVYDRALRRCWPVTLPRELKSRTDYSQPRYPQNPLTRCSCRTTSTCWLRKNYDQTIRHLMFRTKAALSGCKRSIGVWAEHYSRHRTHSRRRPGYYTRSDSFKTLGLVGNQGSTRGR